MEKKKKLDCDDIMKNAERLQLALDFTRDGLFDWNLETNEVYFSPAWKKLLGYGDDEIRNDMSEWERLTDPDDVPEVKQILNEVLAGTRNSLQVEFRMRHKDGHWVYILSRGNVLFDRNGKGWRVVGTHVDISERKRIERELEAKQRELEEAQRIGRVGSWRKAVGEDVVYGTEGYFRLFNLEYDPAGLSRNYIYNAIHPDDRERIHKAMEESNRNHTVFNETFRVLLSDGSERVHNVRAEVKKGEGGQPDMNVGIVHDITDIHQTERALRESRERLSLALDAVSDGVWDWQIESDKLYLSRKWLSMLGYGPEEVAPDMGFWRNLVHPDDRDGFTSILEKSRETGDSFEIEYRMRTSSGPWKWILARGRTVGKDDRGRALRMLGTHLDLDRRKEYEAEILNQKRTAEAYLNMANILFIGLDLDGRIIMANPHAREVLECGDGNILGMDWAETFIPSAMRDYVRRIISAVGRGEIDRMEHFENSVITGSGREIIVAWNNSLITDEEGRPVSILSAGEDITEKKRIAEQLRESQKLESIGSLAGGIAHDFNNILTPVMGLAELLLGELPRKSESYEKVQDILEASERGADLVRQILAFSRKSPPLYSPVALAPIIRDIYKLFRATVPVGVKIIMDIDSPCGPVKADPTQLHQIILNLLTNAIHAMEHRKGDIRVSLGEEYFSAGSAPVSLAEGEYAVLAISDTGCGMPPEVKDRIFEPYFTTKEQGKGTGLGLSVVYGIIKEHSGEVAVESEAGKGTTIRIYLPVIP